MSDLECTVCASGVTSPHGAGAATPGQADQLAVLLDDWRNMLAELEKRRMPSGQVARTALSIERQVHEVHIAQLEGALAAQEPSAADGLLCDNKPVMDALKLALSDPGSITPRAPMESLTSWQRRAVIEHAAPLIIAGQEPHAPDGKTPTPFGITPGFRLITDTGGTRHLVDAGGVRYLTEDEPGFWSLAVGGGNWAAIVQLARGILATAGEQEPRAADGKTDAAHWAALKEYLGGRIDADLAVSASYRKAGDESNASVHGGLVSASRSTLAKMRELESAHDAVAAPDGVETS